MSEYKIDLFGHFSSFRRWVVGFCVKHKDEWRYLTLEKDGRANAASKHMKPGMDGWEIYNMYYDDLKVDAVYLRNLLTNRYPDNYYLSAEKLSEKPCSRKQTQDTMFSILCDKEGRIAFKSEKFNRFLGVDLDAFPNGELQCKARIPGDGEWWTVRLLHHPQIYLSSTGDNQVYAYYNQEANQIHCNQLVPWGQKCQLTLEFLDGKYGLKTIDNKYLHRNGDLVKEPSPDTLFALHVNIKSEQKTGIALMDCKGKFLTTVGNNGVLQTMNTKIGQNELFRVEPSKPQVSLKSIVNGKYLSSTPGITLHTLFIILLFKIVYQKK